MDDWAERDGEPNGEEALNGLVEAGPDGPAKDAIRQAKRLLGWLATALALFPLLPAWILSSDLGGGFAGIFFGTIAWSLGVAIIAFAVIAQPGAWSAAGLALLGFGAFWVSNSIAELLGGTVLNAATPLPTEALPTGVLTWIAQIAVSAIDNYGIVGFIISTILGGIVGWRAAELYKLTNP